ncbi:uncharacterized protein LOC111331165 isoform X2 [Stylophora pistillata]|uniref:uncharacterized protein LOC111331165 isoform X2 n=1 Tax=Stylophora pistillata TaxID=50429 RepID=UPI000C04C287|nr:uncharacterized protein LOC111331165 isoform X2 [Stylophora pistillata]
MQALPYLQLKESESAASSEKKSYRLSLHEVSSKTAQFKDGHSKSGRNVNRPEYSRESNGLFEGTSSIYFGDVAPYCTPVQSLSPSKSFRRPARRQNQSSLPTWLDPLGVWLPSNKKTNCYETFIRNAELLRRTSDMFLDPCPHVPRCSHERTLSALRRQQRRLKMEEDWRKHERNMRIIERIQKIRDMWDQWTNESKSLETEHDNRLNNFRKSRDGYIDPDEIIKRKREERIEHEKLIRLEQAKRREEKLSKQRFKLPKIVVSQYEEPETSPCSRPQSLTNERQSVLPSLVDIPSGLQNRIDKGNDESEVEPQVSKGDSLEVPELESSSQERYYFENVPRAEEQVDTMLPELEQQVPTKVDSIPTKDVTDSIQQAIKCNVETVEGKNAKTLLEDNNGAQLNVKIELESDVVSESVDTKVVEQSALNTEKETADTDKSHEQQKENINSVNISNTEELVETKQANETVELDSIASLEAKEQPQEEESQGRVNKKELSEHGEDTEQANELQMNFLAPPSIPLLAGENDGSDNTSISDADDTASLMGAFIPVALGVGSGLITNDAMRASSVLDRYHVPSQARLNNTKQGKNSGAWKPKINNKKQYLEVDLGALTLVSQVATQGYPTASGVKIHKKDKCWVESYVLAFSTDGSNWQQYTEDGVVKVFNGNRDNNTIAINSIKNPVEARFVRFIPQSWKNSIAMRVEVYGEVTEPDLARTSPSSLLEEEQDRERDLVHEVILEEEEQPDLEKFVCGAENKEVLVEQEVWEEETVHSVVETASQIQSRVAIVSKSSSVDLSLQGEKSPKTKRKSKKPKPEKQEENEEKRKKKKKKKMKKIAKEKKVKALSESSLSLLEEAEEEEEGASSQDEQEEEEEEEEPHRISPIVPEIPKRPESVTRMPPPPKRSLSMFPVRKESSQEPTKPVRQRAQTDDSIRNELMRQQLAEDRRKKLLAATGKSKRNIQVLSPVFDNYGDSAHLDDFLSKYCIISEGQANYYRRIFRSFDEDKDGFLFPEDLLEALESVNSNLLSDSHISYIYRVLELCDCSLDSGVDLKLFSVIAAFSQRVAVLDEFAKILISKLDFRELDFKLQKAKRLFLCYVDEATKTISLEELMLGLTAGGLSDDQKEQTMKILGKTACLDYLDFLTYIPLFIHIHDHILQDPLGTVVYRSMLTV